MLRKLIVGAALMGAVLVAAPTAAQAARAEAFAGVYPNLQAAQTACQNGRAQGRWTGCSYEALAGGQVGLWVG